MGLVRSSRARGRHFHASWATRVVGRPSPRSREPSRPKHVVTPGWLARDGGSTPPASTILFGSSTLWRAPEVVGRAVGSNMRNGPSHPGGWAHRQESGGSPCGRRAAGREATRRVVSGVPWVSEATTPDPPAHDPRDAPRRCPQGACGHRTHTDRATHLLAACPQAAAAMPRSPQSIRVSRASFSRKLSWSPTAPRATAHPVSHQKSIVMPLKSAQVAMLERTRFVDWRHPIGLCRKRATRLHQPPSHAP